MASGDFSIHSQMENDSRQTTHRPYNRFAGKVAIVTGSSSGLGEVVALRLAKEGASVTLTGRDQARLLTMVSRCQVAAMDAGNAAQNSSDVASRFIAVAGNLTEPETRKRIVDQTIATFGRLDVLVSNAGVFTTDKDITEVTEETFDKVWVFDCCINKVIGW